MSDESDEPRPNRRATWPIAVVLCVLGPVFLVYGVLAMAGTYANTYTFTDTQETHLLTNLMYVNVHTNIFPGGEIRAQLNPIPVPEPGTGILLGLGIAGLVAVARRRKA